MDPTFVCCLLVMFNAKPFAERSCQSSLESEQLGVLTEAKAHVEPQHHWAVVAQLPLELGAARIVYDSEVPRHRGERVLAGAFAVKRQESFLPSGEQICRVIMDVRAANELILPLRGDSEDMARYIEIEWTDPMFQWTDLFIMGIKVADTLPDDVLTKDAWPGAPEDAVASPPSLTPPMPDSPSSERSRSPHREGFLFWKTAQQKHMFDL